MRHIKTLTPLLLALVSCQAITQDSTPAVQNGALHAVGCLFTTTLLDRIDVDERERFKAGLSSSLDVVEAFANTGNFTHLTRNELTTQLTNRVAGEYTLWVMAIIDAALISTDTKVEIGEENKQRILAFIAGSRMALATGHVGATAYE